MIGALLRWLRRKPEAAAPIRCIQVGGATYQGPMVGPVHRLSVRYANGSPVMADFGRIDTGLRVVWGRLIEGKEVGA